jgi:hypothetical protein
MFIMFIPQQIGGIVHGFCNAVLSQPFENGLGLVIRRTTIGFLRGAFVAVAPQVHDSAHLQEGVAAERAATLQMKVRAEFRYVSAARPPRRANDGLISGSSDIRSDHVRYPSREPTLLSVGI